MYDIGHSFVIVQETLIKRPPTIRAWHLLACGRAGVARRAGM